MSNIKTSDYTGFSLVSGGLMHRLTAVFRKNNNQEVALRHTTLFIVLITWVPLCIIALLEGTLNDTDLTISFFEDFAMHVRLLFVIPFLILIEGYVDKAFIGYIKNTDKIISNEQQPKFDKLVKRLDMLSELYLPEVILIILIYSLLIVKWDSLPIFSSGRNYLAIAKTQQLNVAGWYYLLFCLPIFQLLIFRWLWRWAIWIYSMFKIARFKLQVDSLHADNMAGLEYINLVPLAFSFILIAPSAVLSAQIGIDIIYNGASLKEFIVAILAYVFFLPIALYAPLLLFVPSLLNAKTYAIQEFGNLIRKHNADYKNVWIKGKGKEGEQILGTMDNSSQNDINGSYTFVQTTQFIPINKRMLLLSFTMNTIPYLPLVFTYYTASELFQDFLQSIIGT